MEVELGTVGLSDVNEQRLPIEEVIITRYIHEPFIILIYRFKSHGKHGLIVGLVRILSIKVSVLALC